MDKLNETPKTVKSLNGIKLFPFVPLPLDPRFYIPKPSTKSISTQTDLFVEIKLENKTKDAEVQYDINDLVNHEWFIVK